MVLLGTPNAESSRLYALTVTEGDPSWAGALAGVALGLPVYHVLEEPVKSQVAPEVYEEQVALMEMVLETDEITHAVQAFRADVMSRQYPSDNESYHLSTETRQALETLLERKRLMRARRQITAVE